MANFYFIFLALLLMVFDSSFSLEQCLFKRIAFSDSIFADKYTKTNISLPPGNEATCGIACSMKGEDCELFKYDNEQGKQPSGICHL